MQGTRGLPWGLRALAVRQVDPRGHLLRLVLFRPPLRDHSGRSSWQTAQQNDEQAAIASAFNPIPPAFMGPALTHMVPALQELGAKCRRQKYTQQLDNT